MSFYRLFPTKDVLVGAYLQRLSQEILDVIDREAAHAKTGADAIRAVLDGVKTDLQRDTFLGCAFNNASMEFANVDHPSRQVAVLIDGAYVSAAHLGVDGPASDGISLAFELVAQSEI